MEEYVKSTYEKLHSMPEVGILTPKTISWLKEQLISFGYEVEEAAGGLVATMDSGKPGVHLGLRADTDALEFFVDGKSVDYHGCFHDCHSTMLITAAKKIAEEGIKSGKLYLIFQPGEEPSLGADRMLATGKLDDIEEMVGMHFYGEPDISHYHVTPALYHKGQGTYFVTIHGQNSHASEPHKGINAVEAGVLAVNAVNMIKAEPDKIWSAKVTQFAADRSSDNTIPDYARLAFDIRAESNELMAYICEKFEKAVKLAVDAVGATCEFEKNINPAPGYDDELVAFVGEVIKETVGVENYCPPLKTSASEDFHFFSYRKGIKTAYMAIGADVNPGLHFYQNTCDLEVLEEGIKIWQAIVRKKLG